MNFQGQDLPTTSVPPGNISRGSYNLTSNDIECIPSELRNSYCAHFYVEFFEIHKEAHLTPEYPNHAMIGIEFAEKCGEYEGVVIDIVADFDDIVSRGDLDFSEHTPGKMVILPLEYKDASPITTRTFQFSPPPQTAPRLLGDVLASITKAGLQHFDFSGEMGGPLLRGCRDFM
ncbi:uncharacterized protein F4807DRAFT_426446 [Annulohypoxylon truncatum]|uniref:uncharacterized protein n=1 Tax=Annulohypoxylon truncatum TaxID=327061 RepID=UPI00200791F2|nr:uncharacterized protein F4807DRAFT_426446 [Annulohypoxylon truncatum]KAI1209358.1 hypothetical protein F4807DRAFT_426446 [Annulohypoxylon truncatum]